MTFSFTNHDATGRKSLPGRRVGKKNEKGEKRREERKREDESGRGER